MNREKLNLEVKRVDNGEWVYGSLIQCDIAMVKRYILPIGK